MKRRNFLSTLASSPLLNTISFDENIGSEGIELAIKADSKKYSKRLMKYKYDTENIEETSLRIYYNSERWHRDVIEAVEAMGFTDHCVWDIDNTSLIYCRYSTDGEYQTLLYEIEPEFTMVSVHQHESYVEVAGEEFETTDDALAEIERIVPDKRGDWAL